MLFACPTIALTPPSPALRSHNQKETFAIEELKALRPGLDASDAGIGELCHLESYPTFVGIQMELPRKVTPTCVGCSRKRADPRGREISQFPAFLLFFRIAANIGGRGNGG